MQAHNNTLDAVSAGTYTGSTSITTLGTISSGTWQGTQVSASYLPKLNSIASPDGAVSLNSQKITNLADPTADADAATKAYVDNSVYLRDVKDSVRVATGSNILISSPGAVVNGVTMDSGDRVLVKSQTAGAENGIYVWNGAAVAMTRAADANSSAKLSPNHYVWVEEGSSADQAFVMTVNGPITMDTTALVYTKFSGLGQITAGDGLSQNATNANQLDVNVAAAGGIEISADNLQLKLDGSSLTTSSSGVKIANSGVGTGQIADNAVNSAKLDSSIAGDGLSGGSGFALKVNTAGVIQTNFDNVVLFYEGANVSSFNGTHFTNNSGEFKIKASGVNTTELAASAVTAAKLGITPAAEAPAGGKDGSNKAFTLAHAPASVSNLMLFLNGLYLTPSTHYSVSGTSITLSEAPVSGDDLRAVYFY